MVELTYKFRADPDERTSYPGVQGCNIGHLDTMLKAMIGAGTSKRLAHGGESAFETAASTPWDGYAFEAIYRGGIVSLVMMDAGEENAPNIEGCLTYKGEFTGKRIFHDLEEQIDLHLTVNHYTIREV